MNKTMCLILLASFSANLVGCGEGPQRNTTANKAILKMRCNSPLAFGGTATADKENLSLQKILSDKYGKSTEPVVVTFLTKYEVSGILNQDSISNIAIAADTADEFAANVAHQVVVTKDCESLTADVQTPGKLFKGLTIESIGLHDIALSGVDGAAEISVKLKKEGRTKMTISDDRKLKARDENRQKGLEVQDFANGNTILNVDIEAKSNGKSDKVSFQQMSGPIDNTVKVKLGANVLALLTGLTNDQAQIDILQSGTTAPVQAPVAGKLTPDTSTEAPKDVEVTVVSLVQFQDQVIDKLPEAPVGTTATPVTPAVEPVAAAPAAKPNTENAANPAAAAAETPSASTQVQATVVK